MTSKRDELLASVTLVDDTFDETLAAYEREVRAQAWDEGYNAVPHMDARNPYRESW